ncbi:hypothetical protein CP97_06965 [Aurantiacibacter atlanticus]|uniref:Lipoprotein n=1 Tax=Aurantiacibacter atlanticus TaxID=1648404 RepID=A0A0H4VFF7_9SPHN|nr:hypothetical protein [Aurantiacibacter atlanticus]AKQ41819.1 hypothetical protein CP97_06965 [Aurantiacibacter atlanticus]MDF1833705.1 hypothetical protein [Alteraurantiacibacter sp. bin_em_oilr2.035]
MKMPSLTCALLCIVLLTGCDASEETEPVAKQPAAVQTPTPVATAAADGTSLAPGTWDITEDAYGAQAKFGVSPSQNSIIISCKSSVDALTISIRSDSVASEAWRLDAGGEAARIDLQTDGNPDFPYMVAQIDQGLGIIHALGEQGQVFTLTSPQGERLQFPSHPGIRRVISACN